MIIVMVVLIEIEKRSANSVKIELDLIIDWHCDESLEGRFLIMVVRKLLQQG